MHYNAEFGGVSFPVRMQILGSLLGLFFFLNKIIYRISLTFYFYRPSQDYYLKRSLKLWYVFVFDAHCENAKKYM